MLLFLLQTASFAQSLIQCADSCYTPEDRKKLAAIIIENDFLKDQDSLKTVIIEKSDRKITIADTLIEKQKSIIFKQDEEINLNKDEIKRLNSLLVEAKKEKLWNRIFSGVMGGGLVTITGVLIWTGITR